MLKVGHIADIHLKGGEDTEEAQALYQAASIFVQHQCRFVFVNGDIYHAKSTPDQRLVFKRFLGTLKKAGIYVVVLRGNHDEPRDLIVFDEGRSGIYLPKIQVSEAPETGILEYGDSLLQFHTIPHFNASKIALESESLGRLGETGSGLFDDIIEGFRLAIASHAGPSMVLFHGVVTEAHLDNGMIPKMDGIHLNGPILSSLGVPVRGGHYHTYQEPHPNVVYSGSITLQNYGETGDKGVVIDTWDGSQWLPHEFVSLNPAPRITVEAVWRDGNFTFPIEGEPDHIYASLADLAPAKFKGARVRFRYQVKQSDVAAVQLDLIRQFFDIAGALDLKFEREIILESAVRSSTILSAKTVFEHHAEWLRFKGLDSKVEPQKVLYEQVCGEEQVSQCV